MSTMTAGTGIPKTFLAKRNRKRPEFPREEWQMIRIDGLTSQPPCEGETGRHDSVDSASTSRDPKGQTCIKTPLKTIFETGSYLFFALLYIIDSGSDIWTAYMYILHNDNWYFWWTFFITVASGLTLIILNLYWYYSEYKDDKIIRPDNMPPKWVWAVRIILTMCLLGPFLRCIEIARLSWKASKTKDDRRKEYYRKRMNLEIEDVAVFALIEAFVESAPQLTLQLYIMQTQGTEKINMSLRLLAQTVSCASSWVCCATSSMSYARANRAARPDCKELSYSAMLVIFLWKLFTIGPRILALALFTSIIRYWVLFAIAIHWLLMTICLISLHRGPKYCNNFISDAFFKVLVGFIYVFTYWNIVDGPTRYRYLAYYVLVYIENLGMVITWFLLTPCAGHWYYIPSFLFVVVVFLLGIAFMLLYYLVCHPTRIRLCRTGHEGQIKVHCEVSGEAPVEIVDTSC